MRASRFVFSFLLLAVVLGAGFAPIRPALAAQAPTDWLPPITFVCPMPEDEVYEDRPGVCPICGMELIPTRIDIAYTCPNHQAIMQAEPGLCPLDRRELVRVNVALHWECTGTRQHFTEPGACADGSERRLVREMRAHGDHNPRHGGLFFMAEDKWHHLEGTYPGENQFRMFLYDNFTQPIEAAGMSGRLVLLSQANQELAAFPLTVSADRKTLEATLRNASLPIKVAAHVKFDAQTPEQRFDFTFNDYSQEPPSVPVTTSAPRPAATSTAAVVPTPVPAPPAVPAPPVATAPGPPPTAPGAVPAYTSAITVENIGDCMTMSRTDATALAQSLPNRPPELLALLSVCSSQVNKLIDSGEFGFIYIPTMLSKDIALALEDHVSTLPTSRRPQAMVAVRRLVLTAWQVDYYGDIGNREKLIEAFGPFVDAVDRVKALYGGQQ